MLDRIVRRLERVRLTRESLTRMGLGIFGGFVLLSILLRIVGLGPSAVEMARWEAASSGPAAGERRLLDHLASHPEDREAWIELCRLRSTSGPLDPLPSIDRVSFDALLRTAPVPLPMLLAWRDSAPGRPALFHLEPFPADFALQREGGRIALACGDPATAAAWFERARRLSPGGVPDPTATGGWTESLFRAGRIEEFGAAIAEPATRRATSPRFVARYHRDRGEYLAMALPMILSQYERWTPGIWVAVSVIGLCWLLLLFHLGGGWSWLRENQALLPVAIALGWLSTELTLLSLVAEEAVLGDEVGRPVTWHLLHALSIGFREELLKLLCFIPLVPLLLRRGGEVQALVLASAVGLGFAMNENGSYYLMDPGDGIIGRFMTANFAHMALTGYAGHHLFRAARLRRRDAWSEAIEAFAKVVVIHAAYDFFILAPQLEEWGILSMIIFIVISQQYLRLLFRVRPHRRSRVSATRVFVGALATVVGMNYLYLSGKVGIGAGIWTTFGGMLGMAVLFFMYFNEFDEHVA